MSPRPAILLVEDDRDEVDVVLRALEQAGFGGLGIEIARDGVEALAALGLGDGESTNGGGVRSPPRVVFLDLKMPRVDGWEVLRNIRAHPRTSEVPVVVVSSSDRREDIARSYALGANSFLVKRFDRTRPGGYIAEAARYWLELNRTPQ
ncbi:MAG: response regulator [Myxococcota bacterium]